MICTSAPAASRGKIPGTARGVENSFATPATGNYDS